MIQILLYQTTFNSILLFSSKQERKEQTVQRILRIDESSRLVLLPRLPKRKEELCGIVLLALRYFGIDDWSSIRHGNHCSR
jgi:hypothetical protein